MIDWRPVWGVRSDSGVRVGVLLDRLAHPPDDLTGIGPWIHGVATASGDTSLADDLTYLFDGATAACVAAGSTPPTGLEAENVPCQPIDSIAPRTGRST